jgi:hypothetical protein
VQFALTVPCIRDRVVQGAVKLILEAVFEADVLIELLRISAEAVATRRAGGSQAQCAAAHVHGHRCGSVALL